MTTAEEEADGYLRRLLTVLFTKRAKRHLHAMSVLYMWSPETLAEHEARFLEPVRFLPVFS